MYPKGAKIILSRNWRIGTIKETFNGRALVIWDDTGARNICSYDAIRLLSPLEELALQADDTGNSRQPRASRVVESAGSVDAQETRSKK